MNTTRNSKRRLVTAALPYVNNVPHLGNLIQVLSADAFARFCRLYGYETLYVCGTDEYGTATETRAALEGVSPRALCDRFHAIHADIYQWFNIAFDKFGRTSTPLQTEIVQELFKKLDANSFIAEKENEQFYCETCARFLADRYVRGICPHCGKEARGDQCENCCKTLDPADLKDPRCATCDSKPSLRKTRHLYIELPKLKEKIENWVADASVKGFWANNAVSMTQAWIRDGLKERAITRDLSWGIPVPKAGYENKVFYVWFDAPIGYISITGAVLADNADNPPQNSQIAQWKARCTNWQEFVEYWWKNPDEVELFQFIGKDNIPFHTVIFPATLLGADDGSASDKKKWTMLHHMSSSEYLNYENGKFSKSKGRGVFGTDAMETGIPADVWRFYIFYNRPEKQDALFTWKDFQEKVNGELIGNLGNLVNRTLSFVSRYYGGNIPFDAENPPHIGQGADGTYSEFWNTAKNFETEIQEKLDRSDLRDAFHTVFALCAFANKTFQDGEPWKTRNTDPPAAAALISDLCLLLRDLAVLISPFMPTAAERLALFFGKTIGGEQGLDWKDVCTPAGIEHVVNPSPLFAKLEDDFVETLRARYAGTQEERKQMEDEKKTEVSAKNAPKEAAAKETAPVAPKTFADLDLRVAQIAKIERHPKADKLYIETLDFGGGEERVIVSGLAPFYKEEELLGKRIIVAYNLKPAKLRGVESQGMLLAASCKGDDGAEIVEVLDACDAPLGTRAVLESAVPAGAESVQISIDEFLSVPIIVQDGTVMAEGRRITLSGAPITTARILNGGVR